MNPSGRLSAVARLRCKALLALSLLAVSGVALALDPSLRLSQYDVRCYGVNEGLPHGSVQDLAQDRQGYLLATTLRGAARFDGVRMRGLAPVGSAALAPQSTERITVSSDGAIWLGSGEFGLTRIDGDDVRRWNAAEGLDSSAITMIAEVDPGELWVSTDRSLYLLNLQDLQPRPLGQGYPGAMRAIARSADGTLWLGTEDGLYRRRQDAGLERMDGTLGLTDPWIWDLHIDPAGSLWIGSRGGLVRWQDERATRYGPEAGLRFPATRAILSDHDGQLWVATAGGGLLRRKGERFEGIDSLGGLPSDIVWSMLEDRSGSLWLGTAAGVCRVLDAEFASFTRRDGLGSEFVWSVAFDDAGAVWAGNNGAGLDRIIDGRVESLGSPGTGPAGVVHALMPEGPGRVLLGTRGGIYRYQNQRFERIDKHWNQATLALLRDAAGRVIVGSDLGLGILEQNRVRLLPMPSSDGRARVRALAPASDGGVYVSTPTGLYHLKGERFRQIPITLTQIRGVWEDPTGVLWIGSTGLYRYQSGRLTRFGSADGFQDSFVHSVLADDQGYLWMTTNVGIWRAPLADLNRSATGTATAVAFERFAEQNGMRSSETNGGSPNIALSADRRLWVATMGGVATVRVDRLANQPPAISAHIEGISVDGVGQRAEAWGELGPDVGRLDIDYTTLEARAPEATEFRFRLSPLDGDWLPAGKSRTASYRRLPPGSYRFELQASSDPLHFAGPIEAIEFNIAPQWYQTPAFRALLLLAGLAVVVGLPLVRVRRLQLQERLLQKEVALRTADLEDANRKLDLAARTDALTGVANRREFNERLTRQIDTLGSFVQSMALALIDVDHFKAYNDQYGHLAGDECLRKIAQTLDATLSPQGIFVARYGGEEFGALLPDHDMARARVALDTARLAIAALDLPHQASSIAPHITVSIGIAAARSGMDPGALIGAADRALYAAKQLGRNRVEVSI